MAKRKLVREIAMEIFKNNLGKPVTPDELTKYVGVGPYASKHVWELRTKSCLDIEVVKTGRKVKYYIWNGGVLGPVSEAKTKEDKPFEAVQVTIDNMKADEVTESFSDKIEDGDLEREFTNLR